LVNTYESSLSHRLSNYVSVEGIPYAGLMSSVVDFHGSTIFCDAGKHRLLFYDLSFFFQSVITVVLLTLLCLLHNFS